MSGAIPERGGRGGTLLPGQEALQAGQLGTDHSLLPRGDISGQGK